MDENQIQPVESESTPLVEGEVVPGAPKRLLRSRQDRVVAGVCGGIGQYFGVDPVLIRGLWVVFTLFTAVVGGAILYLIAAVIIPENRAEEAVPTRRIPIQGNVFWGGLLILAGCYFLITTVGSRYIPSWIWSTFRATAIAVVLIAAGLFLILGYMQKNGQTTGRRLVRSRKQRILGGVCGGLGEYFNVDPTWVRLLWILLAVLSVGVGAVLYVVMMVVLPEEA